VLDPTPVVAGRGRAARRPGRRGLPSLATVVVAAIIGFVVLGWIAAAVFAVLRILELVAVAFVAGWVGFRLGVRRGRAR
jgi:small-conductance mechanosensitive channel